MTDKKLKEIYYQPDYLCTSSKEKKGLHKSTFILKKDVRSWSEKQTISQVHISLP